MHVEKVSFVPDHVHLAVRTHPTQSPGAIIVALMNAAQELMWTEFADSVIQAAWSGRQPGADLGSYGDLESAKIAAYVRRWEEARAFSHAEPNNPPGKPAALGRGEVGRPVTTSVAYSRELTAPGADWPARSDERKHPPGKPAALGRGDWPAGSDERKHPPGKPAALGRGDWPAGSDERKIAGS